MHQFGIGFGFLWVDLLNARSDVPFFGEIEEMKDHSGLSETKEPDAPSEDELKHGDEILAAQGSGDDGGDSKENVPGELKDEETSTPADADSDTTTPGPDDGSRVEEPVKTVKQWNIRSLMWYVYLPFPTLSNHE